MIGRNARSIRERREDAVTVARALAALVRRCSRVGPTNNTSTRALPRETTDTPAGTPGLRAAVHVEENLNAGSGGAREGAGNRPW